MWYPILVLEALGLLGLIASGLAVLASFLLLIVGPFLEDKERAEIKKEMEGKGRWMYLRAIAYAVVGYILFDKAEVLFPALMDWIDGFIK